MGTDKDPPLLRQSVQSRSYVQHRQRVGMVVREMTETPSFCLSFSFSLSLYSELASFQNLKIFRQLMKGAKIVTHPQKNVLNHFSFPDKVVD